MPTTTHSLSSTWQPTSADFGYMQRALSLARRGAGLAFPNPLVGAVIVNDERIVGSGWHQRAGGPHAEVEALGQAGAAASGATLYVNLEPCNHHGRTPPCTDAILRAGIRRVVFAERDPNPNVTGCGAERLQAGGIIVQAGLLADAAREVNLTWHHWTTTGRPFVLLKLATSLDGKIAYADGHSRWISSPIARAQVHRLRRHFNAILIGGRTAIMDNPALTNRSGVGPQPLRVIVDPLLQVPPTARVFQPLVDNQVGPSPIALVCTTSRADIAARTRLEEIGVEVLSFDDERGRVDIDAVLGFLGKRGIQGVFCEGGAKLATTLIRKRLCDRVMLYRAAITIGKEGRPFYELTDDENFEVVPPALSLLRSVTVGPDELSIYRLL